MSSKGVTPVIATVLLIGISVGATFTAYTFLMDASDRTQEGYEERIEQENLEDETAIDIERVYNSSGGYAFLLIRNLGSRPVTLVNDAGDRYLSVFVDGEPVGSTPQDWSFVGSSQDKVGRDSTVTINTTVLFPSSGVKQFRASVRYGASSVHRCAASEGSPC